MKMRYNWQKIRINWNKKIRSLQLRLSKIFRVKNILKLSQKQSKPCHNSDEFTKNGDMPSEINEINYFATLSTKLIRSRARRHINFGGSVNTFSTKNSLKLLCQKLEVSFVSQNFITFLAFLILETIKMW